MSTPAPEQTPRWRPIAGWRSKKQVPVCWEAPGEFCHRRLVAAWLETALGVTVPELVAPAAPTAQQLSLDGLRR